MTNGASTITVELAKKCEALTAKAFPPRVIGDPVSGERKEIRQGCASLLQQVRQERRKSG
jgi:hypothetical protein